MESDVYILLVAIFPAPLPILTLLLPTIWRPAPVPIPTLLAPFDCIPAAQPMDTPLALFVALLLAWYPKDTA